MVKKEQWIELDPQKFQPYQDWKTPSGFLCGTYAASVLLAYYQDQLEPTLLPSEIRSPGEIDQTKLIAYLQPSLQPIDLPTLPVQISLFLNHFLARYSTLNLTSRFTSYGGWHRIVKRISAGKPVMVGVLKVLGSTYGNHWVVAYGFYEANDGKRYLKVHDNWGNYEKIIPAHWVNGTISFP